MSKGEHQGLGDSPQGKDNVVSHVPHAFRDCRSLIDAKNARRYDDCLKYAVVSGRKALIQAGLDKERSPEGYAKLDVTRVGVLIGTGMGGLTVFQDGKNMSCC